MREHYRSHGTQGYVPKYDIRSYFASIDHSVLKRMIASIPDARVLALLHHIIDSYPGAYNEATGTWRGLPMGNQTSQWFALYYLDPMDRLIKERMRVRHYVRHMDDGVLLHPSKEYLREVLSRIRELAAILHLELNDKTQIFPLSQGVDFLGFHFYLTDTGKVVRRLRTSSKRRWKRRLKKLQEEFSAGEKSLDDIRRSIASYNGHLGHGDTYKLRKKVMGSYVLRCPHEGE